MTHDEIDALATRFFDAVESGDMETVAAIYAPDALVWHNTDNVEQGRNDNLTTLAWVHKTLPDRKYEEIRRVVLDDGFVQQHVLRATAPSGVPFVMPAMMRVYCEDGCITRIEEYIDSAPVSLLR